MKNKRNILFGAFAVLALSLAGGLLAFTANAEETAAKTLADISIGMVKGASMRIGSAEEGNTEESTGLRFTMQVSKADYEALDKTQYKNIEWGMLIAPVESVKAAEFNAENLFGANAKYVFNEETAAEGKYAAINVTETALTPASETNLKIDNADNYYVFSGYMHTIKAGNLTRGFVGRGYVKYTVKGEETPQYKFAEYFGGNAENNTRSAYYVAAKYVSDAAVTDTDAKNYVRTNYLENAVALKTASVNITANDYLEDITVGTYKTEVSETNTVTAKIGEKYDLSAESNAKEGYALREELSSATTPVYRGQQLSIKRYYESESYIPFSSAGSITKETEGDFAGAYKFTGTRLQLASGDLKNYKVLKGVTVPEDGKVHLVNYVTMKAYYTTYGAFNLVSQLGDGVIGDNKWAVSVDWYDSSEGGVGDGYKLNESKVAYYDENGYRTFKLNTNTWYTVAFPVHTNYHDSARFGGMYWDFPANNTLYFKDVKIENKAVDPFDVPAAYADLLNVGTSSTTETPVTEGDFAGSKKIETTSNAWEAGLCIVGVSEAETQRVLTKGVKYVSFDVYFTGATSGVYFWDNICKDNKDSDGKELRIDVTATLGEALPSYNYTFTYNNNGVWGKWNGFHSGSGKTAEILRFYDKDGNKADTLQKDTWYTAVLMLTTGNKGGFWGSMRFSPRGGSEETPAIMYYNNLRYSCANPKA